MKKLIFTVITIMIALIISACAANESPNVIDGSKDNTQTDAFSTNTVSSEENTIISTENADSDVSDKVESTDTYAPPAIGGDLLCQIHHYRYHAIPGELITLVGSDEFAEWIEDVNSRDLSTQTGCQDPLTIKLFIDEFDISRNQFVNACSMLALCEINLDVLFSGTNAEIEQYFKNIDELEVFGTKRTHYDRSIDYIRKEYENELSKIETNSITRCIPKLVAMLDIEKDALERIIKKAADDIASDLGEVHTFDYNLDMIYGTGEMQAGEVSLNPSVDILAVNEDDDPTNDISSNELDEMFCRVGRYAE